MAEQVTTSLGRISEPYIAEIATKNLWWSVGRRYGSKRTAISVSKNYKAYSRRVRDTRTGEIVWQSK